MISDEDLPPWAHQIAELGVAVGALRVGDDVHVDAEHQLFFADRPVGAGIEQDLVLAVHLGGMVQHPVGDVRVEPDEVVLGKRKKGKGGKGEKGGYSKGFHRKIGREYWQFFC